MPVLRFVMLLLLLSALPGVGQAQPAAPVAQTPPSTAAPGLLDRVRGLGLSLSPGPVQTWHPPELTARATALRALIEDAAAYFRDTLGVEAELHLAVLTREQWQAVIRGQPYGIPGVAGRPPVIFMPATDDGLATTDALALKDRVAPSTLRRLADAGFSYEAAAARYVDLVGLHELGHVFTHQYGIRPDSRWLDELLATYFAYAYLRARRPDLVPLWEGVLQAYVDAVRPAHRSLADFDRLYFGVGAQNYVWYQAQFQVLVTRVYAARGLDLLRELRGAFAATSSVTPGAPLIVQRLEPLMPGIREWADALDSSAAGR